jgi:hypothetical protein
MSEPLLNPADQNWNVIAQSITTSTSGTEDGYLTLKPANGLKVTTIGEGLPDVPNALFYNTATKVITYSNNAVGPTGPQGTQGPQGITGSQGIQGITGPQGVQGLQGITGNNGSNGTNGTNGIDGPTGPQGLQGGQGPAGPTYTGTTGNVGPTGPQGIQGIQGTAGTNGIDGTNGTNGTDGAQGIQGPQGDQGPQGNQGAQGTQGIQGVQGTPGAQYNQDLNTFNNVSFNTIISAGNIRIDGNSNGFKINGSTSGDYWNALRGDNVFLMRVSGQGIYSATVGSPNRAVYVSSSNVLATFQSSRRLKNSITEYEFNENAILSVKPYRFKYNANGDADIWQYGFMAEDINDAGLPEMCGFDKDGLPDYVSYERFCIAQQQIIRKLWDKVKYLEDEVEKLKNK